MPSGYWNTQFPYMMFMSQENEKYFFTLFKSSLQASFFRRRVGIRAAFEVLLQIQDTDSDLPL